MWQIRGEFGIYYLSAVSERVCDTPCILYFWKLFDDATGSITSGQR